MPIKLYQHDSCHLQHLWQASITNLLINSVPQMHRGLNWVSNELVWPSTCVLHSDNSVEVVDEHMQAQLDGLLFPG